MSNTSKRYRLLKDLPYLKAGAIYELDGIDTYQCKNETAQFTEGTKWDALGKDAVEKAAPGWFELIPEEVEKERITVGIVKAIGNNSDGLWYKFNLPYSEIDINEIPNEKLPLIKQAIESILNDDSPFMGYTIKQSDWNLIEQTIGKRYSQQQLEQAEKDAFNSAREVVAPKINYIYDHHKYPTFQDYKKEKQSLSPYNAWDTKEDVENRMKLEGRKFHQPSNMSTSENNVLPNSGKDWEILKGRSTNGDNIHDWDTNPAPSLSCEKNGCKIHSVKRLSDNTIWTVGELHGGFSYTEKESRKIVSFWIDDDNKMMVTQSGGDTKFQDLKKAAYLSPPPPERKDPEALFTTEDGKEIFDKQKFWLLYITTYSLSETHARKELLPFQSYQKTFSTKQAAQEYVTMNKPCLSIKDIDSCTHGKILDDEKLISLVKSKTN